jgi:hypothetical protein
MITASPEVPAVPIKTEPTTPVSSTVTRTVSLMSEKGVAEKGEKPNMRLPPPFSA